MTTPNDRQRQAEEMANKYCDENFATQHHDEYWENKSSYLKGWTDADSTPPQQEGDEEVVNKFAEQYIDPQTAERVREAVEFGIAHARRTQNSEVERLKKEVEELKDIRDADTIRIDERRSLLERAEKIIGPYVRAPEAHRPLKESWLSDYEKLMGKKG